MNISVVRLEGGMPVQTTTLVRVLRALHLLSCPDHRGINPSNGDSSLTREEVTEDQDAYRQQEDPTRGSLQVG